MSWNQIKLSPLKILLIQPANELFLFPQENLHEQLALGLLAGNVFDWGAKEVALLMESGTGLRFEDALKFVNQIKLFLLKILLIQPANELLQGLSWEFETAGANH